MTEQSSRFRIPFIESPWMPIAPILLLGLLSAASYYLYANEIMSHALIMATQRGQLVFSMVQTTRFWNARHGSLYVPVTPTTPPNPYLDAPEKTITTPTGIELTWVNPAYMTRQIADILKEQGEMTIHLTSLKPINPRNAPDVWEAAALQQFERGRAEIAELVETSRGTVFRYMAPLLVQKPCLQCHLKQDYRLGDVRGGLSVTQPAMPMLESINHQTRIAIAIHLMFFTVMASGTWISLSLLRRNVRTLTQERDERRQVAEQLAEKMRVLQHTQRALVQSETLASLGRLVAGFAHEVNIPVESALDSAARIHEAVPSIRMLLQQEPLDEQALQSQLEEINQSTVQVQSNLHRAADSIQSFKRTSVDQSSGTKRQFMMHELVDDLLRGQHNHFKRTAIRFDVEVPPDLHLYGPAGALEHVLSSLMLNSLQHGFQDGQLPGMIRIRAEIDHHILELEVRDDGTGMDEATRSQIFEPFFTRRRGRGSSGLGLYIVDQIVHQQLSGTIGCNSQPGKGTRFLIRIPMEHFTLIAAPANSPIA